MSLSRSVADILAVLRGEAFRLGGDDRDYDALLEAVGDRRFVLLGEATHGSREFYAMRAAITRRLVLEKGFDAIALEGDWPDVHRLHRYVCGDGAEPAEAAFADFERFPRWMWRNAPMLAFVRRLHEDNALRTRQAAVGLYGVDIYSLYRSAEAVIGYLQGVDSEQAERAREQYAALDHVRDPQRYGYEAAHGLRPDCREAVRERLVDLLRRAPAQPAGPADADERFVAERNAHVVMSAEAYYREMFGAPSDSWNRRDLHMVQTLFALQRHLQAQGRRGRIVVWAHNSHLGDARATQMGEAGEWNVGQLVRETVGAHDALLVGFTTYAGTVTAAEEWGGAGERRTVLPALPDSIEDLFRRTGLDRFYLPLSGVAGRVLSEPRLERAIGVLYRPRTERASHYFLARVPAQFDAVFHLDETEAVEPLAD